MALSFTRNPRFPVPAPKLTGRPWQAVTLELQEFLRRLSGEITNTDADLVTIANTLQISQGGTVIAGDTAEESELLAFLRL